MTCSADLQSAYEWLYSRMRNYIWDLDVVEMLADVEVDTFDAFIDYEKAEKDFNKLYTAVKDVADANKDEELLKSADDFKKLIQDALEDESPAVFSLLKVQETVGNPEQEEEEIQKQLEEYEAEENELLEEEFPEEELEEAELEEENPEENEEVEV